MNVREHVPGGDDTEALSARGWSQFGSTPPRRGQYDVGFRPAGTAPGPFSTVMMPPPPPPNARGTRSGRHKAVVGLALVAVALGGGATGALISTTLQGGPTVVTSPVIQPAAGSSGGSSVSQVAKAVMPSVVSIKVKTGVAEGEGSGVILSGDGMILTNNHVVSQAAGPAQSVITVRFSDGKTASAALKGTDPATDLAVIQATGVSGLTPASLGDSDKLQVGDAVLAIGSPLGLAGSVTAGIVSALDRTLNEGSHQPPQFPWDQQQRQSLTTIIGGMIQTDAAINPGNSGGALVNSAGQVVGINTAIATSGPGSGNIGVGFAIPINTARQVADQLIKHGKATHAFLGVSVADATGGTPGALISAITAGSPAAKAGLREGDLIVNINNKVVESAETLIGVIRSSRPGDQITISYVRDGATSTITVKLAEQAASTG